MSQAVDLNTLAKMANEVLNGKEYFVGAILSRLNDGASGTPHDQAIKTAQRVLSAKLNKEGTWSTITQVEFQRLYDDVSGLGNKQSFRELVGEFLHTGACGKVAYYNDEFISGTRNSGSAIDVSNPDMVEELGNLFDNTKITVSSFVDNGRKGLEIELASFGVSNPSVEVVAKNSNFIIFAAQADSTNGPVQVLIPAEIKLGHTLMPSVFVSGTEFVDLTAENLVAHAQATAVGKVANLDAPRVLNALTAALNNSSSVVKMATDDSEFRPEDNLLADSPIYSPIDDTPDLFEVETRYADLPPELDHLTEGTIREALVEAGLSFTKELVASAKSIVSNELIGMGIQTNKISVVSEFDGGITISANIIGKSGQKTIEVPVEIINNNVLMPSVFTSGITAKSFDEPSLQSFANDVNVGVFKTAFSDKLGWSYRELHEHALKNAAKGNFIESEEALAVINDEFGPDFHRAAFSDLTSLLSLAVTEEQRPMYAMERYVEDAIAKSESHEANIKMSDTMLYLHPED